jgi:hypothetical protein
MAIQDEWFRGATRQKLIDIAAEANAAKKGSELLMSYSSVNAHGSNLLYTLFNKFEDRTEGTTLNFARSGVSNHDSEMIQELPEGFIPKKLLPESCVRDGERYNQDTKEEPVFLYVARKVIIDFLATTRVVINGKCSTT